MRTNAGTKGAIHEVVPFKLSTMAAAVLSVGLLAACNGNDGRDGLQGAPGAPGAPGMDGAPGAPGTDGADGVDGADGAPGADGNVAVACTVPATVPADVPSEAILLTSQNKLRVFNPRTGMATGMDIAITGLAAGETVVGIDFRPIDGALIALARNGATGNLYRIDRASGAATQLINVSANPLTLSATQYGFDFNPAVPVPAALRIVGSDGQNLRAIFADGANLNNYAVNNDTTLSPSQSVVAAAYTNSFGSSALTSLYTLDAERGVLLLQGGVDSATNPNAGMLTDVGPLGVSFSGRASFDVDGVTGAALAVLNVSNTSVSRLYSVNLGSGAATCLGELDFLSGVEVVSGFAIPTPQPALAFGLTTTDALVQFTPNAAGVSNVSAPLPITGLGVGETVVGMDIRPRTGALTIVTRDPATNAGNLYEVSPSTGAATLIPANTGQMLAFDAAATSFGVDFNPVPNALRVVNNAGQNFRITFPADQPGYNVLTDGAVNPVGESTAAGYTSNFDGTMSTRLYVIDSGSNELKFQNPPNDGTQVVVGPLGVMVTAANGMDIVGGAGVTSGGVNIGNTITFAALEVMGETRLFRINLETGVATQIGNTPIGGATPVVLKGLAVRVSR